MASRRRAGSPAAAAKSLSSVTSRCTATVRCTSGVTSTSGADRLDGVGGAGRGRHRFAVTGPHARHGPARGRLGTQVETDVRSGSQHRPFGQPGLTTPPAARDGPCPRQERSLPGEPHVEGDLPELGGRAWDQRPLADPRAVVAGLRRRRRPRAGRPSRRGPPRTSSSSRNCSGPPISTDRRSAARPPRRGRPPAATSSAAIGWMSAGGRWTVSSTVLTSAMALTNSKNWVACTIEYGMARLADQLLLGDLRAEVARLRHPLRADHRQRDVVADPGLRGVRAGCVVEVRKNSITASSANDGEFDTSTTTAAPVEHLREPLAGERVHPGVRGSGHRLVAVLAQLGHQLRPDQPGPTDDHDLHDVSLHPNGSGHPHRVATDRSTTRPRST